MHFILINTHYTAIYILSNVILHYDLQYPQNISNFESIKKNQ